MIKVGPNNDENFKRLVLKHIETLFFSIQDKCFDQNYRGMSQTLVLYHTRKYPLRGYILGVLTHTTALDQLWGGDETEK